jgi:hypothetical protein
MTTTRKTYTTCDGAVEFAECEHGVAVADVDPSAPACAACEEPTDAELAKLHDCWRCDSPAHTGRACCDNCSHFMRRYRNRDGSKLA